MRYCFTTIWMMTLALSCSSGGGSGDESTTTTSQDSGIAGGNPVFYFSDIRPILKKSCAPCHTSGGTAAAKYSWDFYYNGSTGVWDIAKKRGLPRFLPDDSLHKSVHFTEDEKKTLDHWGDLGLPSH